MKNLSTFLDDLKKKPFDFEWSTQILNASKQDLDEILKVTREKTDQQFGKILKGFVPGRTFPAISITGKQCSLNCAHCNHHYLSNMLNGNTPENLWKIAEKLVERKAIGCLLSGGYDKTAQVPFARFLPTIKRIKEETSLILNVHVGIIQEEMIRNLEEVGIDIVSFDVVGSDETIKKVYGLERYSKDYLRSLELLMASKIPFVVPHVCVGLDFGQIVGEIEALKNLQELKPSLLVFLGLIPTKGTPMEAVKIDPLDVVKVIAIARLAFPHAEIGVGCMRPGGNIRQEIDELSFRAGINRLVLPSKRFLTSINSLGYEYIQYDTCCALPSSILK
ncbi:MAG: radical SAM protein [Candidatus Helarchaeota archaeon]